jgi:hypothetical protein
MKRLSERANGATLDMKVQLNRKPTYDTKTTPQATAQRNPRIFVLHAMDSSQHTWLSSGAYWRVFSPRLEGVSARLHLAAIVRAQGAFDLGAHAGQALVLNAVGGGNHERLEAARELSPDPVDADGKDSGKS